MIELNTTLSRPRLTVFDIIYNNLGYLEYLDGNALSKNFIRESMSVDDVEKFSKDYIDGILYKTHHGLFDSDDFDVDTMLPNGVRLIARIENRTTRSILVKINEQTFIEWKFNNA